MEPLDPAKNDESNGSSRRRISSILKAPRKSTIFPHPEQQEKVVECPKIEEKRNSRRVSFAPANDVLLFSSNAKKASPTRSPLQDLMTTAAATKNRVQVGLTEDGIQQIAGMETLLNAPLHASQLRDKVNSDVGGDFGEKTVMFSTDDAFMDMTRCQTINIANDKELLADLSLQNCDILPTGGEKTMFTAGDGSMDITQSQTANIASGTVSPPTGTSKDFSAEKSSVNSSVPHLIPAFENFLANLFKPSVPGVNPTTTNVTPPAGASSAETNISSAHIKTQRADVDKENQAPASLSAVTEKSINTSRRIESSSGCALYPKDDKSMEITETQTGRIQGFTDDYDDTPFQSRFPTQDVSSRLDDRVSQTGEKPAQQQGGKTSASVNTKDLISSKTPSLHAPQPRHTVNLDTKDERGEKTIMSTADDEFMHMTQSQTVNISCGSLAPAKQNRTCATLDNASSLQDRRRETLEPGFNRCLAGIFKTSSPRGNPEIGRAVPPAAASHQEMVKTIGYLSQHNTDVGKENRSLNITICPANDVSMEVTEAQTGLGSSDDPFLSTQDMYPRRESLKRAETTSGEKTSTAPGPFNSAGLETSLKPFLKSNVRTHQVKFSAEDDCGDKTVRFSADEAFMDVTRGHTVNIVRDLEIYSHQNVDALPACGEKTDMFTANNTAMDVTQCLTAHIAADLNLDSRQNVDALPACGEKTVKFDAAMDVTQSLTVNIATDIGSQSLRTVDCLPARGEKTVRFTAKDACMDVTQSHTVNIAADLKLDSHQNVDALPACGEKTVKFDAAMDVTQCLTANIATDLKLDSHLNVDALPACGEKTVKFDAAMDVTQCLTANIATNFDAQSHQDLDFLPPRREEAEFSANDAAVDVTGSRSVNVATDSMTCAGLPDGDSKIPSSHENEDFFFPSRRRGSETRYPRRNQSSSARTLEPDFEILPSKTTDPGANPVITKAASAAPLQTVETRGFLDQPKRQEPDVDTANEAPGYTSAVTGNPVNNTMVDCQKDNVRMAMTEAQTDTDEPPLFSSSTRSFYSDCDHLDKTEVTSQQCNVALETFNLKGAEITNHTDYLDSIEADNAKEPEQRNQASSPNTGDNVVDAAPSRKSRRASLAHLQSKIRRLSHMINTAPDTVAAESCTAALPPLEDDDDKDAKDKTKSLPATVPEPETVFESTEENTQARCLMGGGQPCAASTTPFNLKTAQLMSRLSMGGFKAKFPERSKPNNSTKANLAGEQTRTVTVNVTNQQSNFDGDVSNIYDEELLSYEDMSEVLDARSPQKATEKRSPPLECDTDEPLKKVVFEEGLISAVCGKKRSLPVDENHTEDEKRIKGATETTADFDMGSPSHLAECDSSNSTAPCVTTQTADDPNGSQTASMRCEATFESTFKQSLFESQLEDYASDVQMKFDDGSVTVFEFFKHFNIDFVIHNPRQSVRPENILSDADLTPMDLLKDRHINHPKQMVYEKEVLALTEKVEGLKERKRDLDKPLKIVNKRLWEDMRSSSEKERKSFGAKLKERNKLFRKTSKALSHEMKESLYSNLVQANLEERQRLRGTIEEADEMLKSLEDCIRGIEAELAAVEEKGFEDKPSLKSLQEEMKKVNEALADNDRQITEAEMQKNQNMKKLNRLKAETKNLESNMNTLHLLSEWRFGEKGDNCTVFTFLHETFHLQLVYEESTGKDVDDQSERKIMQITFNSQLDAEKSQDHACLVHKLLTQYVEGEAAWVEKYPTSSYVPKLLHDVSLVMGRCRLLGEELRQLKMWGGLKLDILSIRCVDTQVHIVFSSLKKSSKFEVILSVSLTNHLCVLHLESFKNVIGSTTIQQIEEIVVSFSPGRNTLTKILKKIHENLLC